ncbi:MAG: type III-B CRISPR module RAMP protein Cmr1 [Defluviitoga tunisiensis]|jgi:CRISPR-associated protein Cmr1|nr:type III-B CRISPR module RAMP protein Cmr1 [Defluviitoga tunisiensis]HPZ66927.1 type III-B CRISPR module RAMP protein Cmr1 [Defluviitoga tunisiensis]HQD43760.1 type III-B CRISPR module RAMP protein Cmr1 [Defluviitoga tunisiensis]
MYKTKFKLNVVTPLFMYGGDTQRPEVRTTEFKGLIRFWWRALKASKNIESLKKEEEAIFGGISKDSGKSKVSIQITDEKLYFGDSLRDEYKLNFRYNREKRIMEGKDAAIVYLLYSTVQKNPKKFIKQNSSFSLSLYSQDENALKNAIAGLWCALNIGAFGTRSRRGAGSLSVKEIEGNTYGLDFTPKGSSRKDITNWLKENKTIAANIVGAENEPCNKYSNLNDASFIVSKRSFDSWQGALQEIGNEYMNFRIKKRKDVQLGVFGLPIIHSDKSKIEAKYNKNYIRRRASPLLIKVIKCKDGYRWLLLQFSGDIFPEGTKLVWTGKEKEEKPRKEIIDDFWTNVKDMNNDL